MATTSAARVAANQKNAQRSTGPRTAEGKERSRVNALKHGLTGAGIALPTEDAAVVERRFLDLQVELAPGTLEASLLVRQAALMSVRIDRAALGESAALALNIRRAETEFDLAHAAAIDRLFTTIETNPAENRRRLLVTVEGVTQLIDALASASIQLDTEAFRRWDQDDKTKLAALFGETWGLFTSARSTGLLMALTGNFDYIPPAAIADLADKSARIEWARHALIALINAEVDRLQTHRVGLDPRRVEEDRREAAQRALFDPSAEATLARRYEAAALRSFHKALRDFRALPVPTAAVSDPITVPTGPEALVDPPHAAVPDALVAASGEALPDEAEAERPNEPNGTPAASRVPTRPRANPSRYRDQAGQDPHDRPVASVDPSISPPIGP